MEKAQPPAPPFKAYIHQSFICLVLLPKFRVNKKKTCVISADWTGLANHLHGLWCTQTQEEENIEMWGQQTRKPRPDRPFRKKSVDPSFWNTYVKSMGPLNCEMFGQERQASSRFEQARNVWMGPKCGVMTGSLRALNHKETRRIYLNRVFIFYSVKFDKIRFSTLYCRRCFTNNWIDSDRTFQNFPSLHLLSVWTL